MLKDDCPTDGGSCPVGVIVLKGRCPEGVLVLGGNWQIGSLN